MSPSQEIRARMTVDVGKVRSSLGLPLPDINRQRFRASVD